jgi:tRNA(adenine34) deaminase
MSIIPESHEKYMQIAYQQAEKALSENEVPVGAVVVCKGQIIAKGYNQTERLCDVTAHAEMIALTAAANYLGAKYLKECTLYVTLEPCVMCGGALAWSQIGNVVFGAADEKRGAQRLSENIFHPKTNVVGGILEEKCSEIMLAFFKKKRT